MQLNEILGIENPIGIPLPPKPLKDQIKEKQPLPWIRAPTYITPIEINDPIITDYIEMILNRKQPPNYESIKASNVGYLSGLGFYNINQNI